MNDEEKVKEENQDQDTTMVIEETMIPVKNPEVTVREEMEEDGRYILFNAENELILVINQTGKFILDNCDGEKSIGQIIGDIEKNFSLKDDMDLSAIVKEYLATLLKAQLVKIKEEI